MRLTTIWTIPAMTLGERLRRTREWTAMEVASRLPKRIRYWTTILEIAKVTTQKLPEEAVPDITLTDVLQNLDAPKSVC